MCLERWEKVITDVDGRERTIKMRCGRCWQCRTIRVSDWIGRCIAEQTMSAAAGFVTLTYGGDERIASGEVLMNPRAQAIHYEDFQKYLMRIRNNTDGKVRFFVTAEMGPLKGRVHFHAILFFERSAPPNIELYKRYVHMAETPDQAAVNGSRYSGGRKLWDEGFSFWEDADLNSFRYCVKYILKDQSEAAAEYTKAMGLSCKPPLGYKYFTQVLAPKYVEQEVPLRDLFYQFPDVVERKVERRVTAGGMTLVPRERPIRFHLLGQMARHFMDAYVRLWRERYGDRVWPQSDLLDERQDALARRHRGREHLMDEDERYWSLYKRDKRNPARVLPSIIADPGPGLPWNRYEAMSRGW